MTFAEATREEVLLRPLRQYFEAQGYTFFEHPAHELVPAFLGSYAPDAIAYDRSGGGVVIEIKSRPDTRSRNQLSRIAKLFEDQKEWKLHVVYGSSDSNPDDQLAAPAIGTIRTAFTELEALEAGGHFQPGFLFAWSLLEAAGRLLDPQDGSATPPRQLIERLTSEGFVSQATSARLRGLVPLRHAIAHGDYSRRVGPSELSTMKAAIEEVLGRLRPSMG